MPTRTETHSLADLLADVAYRKSRAAHIRFARSPAGKETPREVYLAACAAIGAHLEEMFGFKYAKSGPRARRRSGDFTFEISFQSSHHNIAGAHVVLWIHGNVWSARMNKWREGQPHVRPSDYVAGGQVGNLQTDHSWLEWNLANRRKRDKTIHDAVKVIEDLALTYFARFEDLPSLFRLLVKEEMPSMEIDRVIEFLMCFADQPTARLAAAKFLKKRRDLLQEYQQSYQRYVKDGLGSKRPSGYAEQLAFASHAFKFGDLTVRGST
jgi:hypothetical protein